MTEFIEAVPSDAPRLGAFLRKAWKEAGPGALGWTGAKDANMEEIASEAFLSGLLAEPTTKVFAAQDAGEFLGVAVLRRLEATVGELAGIIVLESRTGEGVGRSLLAAVLEHARADGTKEIVVRTEAANNRALRFYQGFGFDIVDRGPEDVQGAKVNLVTLRCRLD